MKMKQIPTWPETKDVSSIGIRLRQDCKKAFVQNVLHRGWLQVLEHLWPGFATCMVIEQQLQGTVVIKLPGPQETQEKGIIQPRSEIRLLLQSQ